MKVQRTRTAWLAAVLCLGVSGCSGCAKKETPAVAVEKPIVAPVKVQKRSTDFRTLVLTLLPEFRGLQVTRASALLSRRYVQPVKNEQFAATLSRNGFGRNDAGFDARENLVLVNKPPRVVLTMELDAARLLDLISVPSAMGTEQLALWFPDGAFDREDFQFVVEYVSSEKRAAFLAWQLATVSQRTRWHADSFSEGFNPEGVGDGGAGEQPTRFEISLSNSVDEERLHIERDGHKVSLLYRLKTGVSPSDPDRE